MPTVIRRLKATLIETRRETHSAMGWFVRSNSWSPPTDVYETENSMIVKVEIAGMRDEDIEVAIQDDLLLVDGIRLDSSERRAFHQMEIPFGKFSINVKLTMPVNVDKALAEYKDGFLTILLPKEMAGD